MDCVPASRRHYRGATIVAAALACAFVSVPGNASAAAAGTTLRVEALTPGAVPGGAANAAVVIGSGGASAAAATVSFRVPAGLTFLGSSPFGRSARIACRSAGGTVSCATRALPARSVVAAILRFRVGAKANGRVAIAVSGGGSVAGRRGRAVFAVRPGAETPTLVVDLGGASSVRPDRSGVLSFDVVNVGTGSASSVELRDVLPVSVAGGWKARGRGWSCSASLTCRSSATIAPGFAAPRLTIAYRLDEQKVAGLGLVAGGRPSIQRWTVGASAAGSTAAGTPAELAVLAPSAAQIIVSAAARGDKLELLPGASATVAVVLQNTGAPATGGIVLAVTVPESLSVTAVSPGSWRCDGIGAAPAPGGARSVVCRTSSGLGTKGRLRASLHVVAGKDAKPGLANLDVGAVAGNSQPTVAPKSSVLPFEILEGDTGFPALTLLRAVGSGRVAPVTDGSAAHLLSGHALTERLDVRNAGGAAMTTGSRLVLTQSLSAGSAISSTRSSGWSCSGRASLACSIVLARPLAPGATVAGPTVTVAAGAATKGERAWKATVSLSPLGATRAAHLPVLVEITRGTTRLVPNLKTLRVPTAGGAGGFTLGVRNDGTQATAEPVTAGIHMPRGAHLTHLDAHGWRCTWTKASARCVSPAALAAGAHLPQIGLTVAFARTTANRTLTIGVRASAGGHAATGSAQVLPRHGLVARIHHSVHEVTDLEPVVRGAVDARPTTLLLEGDGSGGSDAALHYHWTQRCTTAADARAAGSRCAGITPPVRWLTSRTDGDVEVEMPRVARPTVLVFQLKVDDASASSTALTRVRVVPLASAGAGIAFRNAHPRAERPETVTVRPRKLPPASAKLTDPAPAPKPDTAVPVTTLATSAVTPLFCQVVAAARSGGDASLVGGALEISFGSAGAGTGCDASTSVSFSGASFAIHGYLHASGVSGTVTSKGIAFSSGTIAAPASWRAPAFPAGGVTVTFTDTGAALGGRVSASGDVPFLPLTGRWEAQTSLIFDAGGGVSVGVAGTGPRSETSVASPLPAISIAGPVAADGTFSLDLGLINIVQLRGHGISVVGKVTRNAAGEIDYGATGSLAEPFDVIRGVQVASLTLHVKPTESSLGVTGTGTIALLGKGDDASIPFKLAYAEPRDWSLKTDGASAKEWKPVPGLTVASDEFRGEIVAADDHLTIDLKAQFAQPWSPASGITIRNSVLTLEAGCPDLLGKGFCAHHATAYLDVQGDATFAFPKTSTTVSAKLAGVFVLQSGEFRVTAELPETLSLGGGVSVDRASVVVQRGVPLPPEEPAVVALDATQTVVDVTGGLTVPALGKLPIVHATFASGGWAIAAPIGDFTVPGTSTRITNTVLGWSTFATSIEVYDRPTAKRVRIAIPANSFRLSGDFAAPSWVRGALHLSGEVTGRATGAFEPNGDTYALRMELGLGQPSYLYGDATSASSLKLTSGFVEIVRTPSVFNVSLGGVAKLTVAGGGSLAASSADLTVALGLDTGGTIVGKLGLVSKDGWRDAFGVDGLTLHGLALQFGLKLPNPVPDLGFAADAVLPESIRSALGVTAGSRTLVVANISPRTPCLGVQVKPSAPAANALHIGGGVVTAREFELRFAPKGCTVDTYVYKPGAAFKFDGKVGGISVALEATVGFKPFTFDGSLRLAEVAAGGLALKETTIEAHLAPGSLRVTFTGGASIYGSNVTVTGKVSQIGGKSVFDLTGTLDKLDLGDILTARNLRVTVVLSRGEKDVVAVRASGNVTFLGTSVDGTFAFALENGKLDDLESDLVARVRVGGDRGLSLNGTFNVAASRTTKIPKVDAKVTVSAAGTTLQQADVVIHNGFIQLRAAYTYGSVFNAALEGAAYYGRVPAGATSLRPDGVAVPAQIGDFYLAAPNVSLKLGSFGGATGYVWIGRVGGAAYAHLATSVQLTGGGLSNSVRVAGVIDAANSTFDLEGTGRLDLAGFTQTVAVSVKKRGDTVAVTGRASVGLLGSSVEVAGEFAVSDSQFRFRLKGIADLSVAGYKLAGTDVTLSNFPADAGFYAKATVTAGPVTLGGRIAVRPDGRFFVRLNQGVSFPAGNAYGAVTFANYETRCKSYGFFELFARIARGLVPECTDVDVPTYLTVDAGVYVRDVHFAIFVRIYGNGSFEAEARTPRVGETVLTTPTTGTWPVDLYAELRYYFVLRLTSASPYFDFGAKAEAAVNWDYWTPVSWSGWSTFLRVGVEIKSFNPFHGCLRASVAGIDFNPCV